MIGLDEARRAVTEHAETCLDPRCWRIKHALDSAHWAEALRLIREACDPADRSIDGIPPWSEVSRPEQNAEQN